MKSNELKALTVLANSSEVFQARSNIVVLKITTTESSTVVVQSSADSEDLDAIDDVSWTIDGTSTKILSDVKPGMYLKVVATAGTMTAVKILN